MAATEEELVLRVIAFHDAVLPGSEWRLEARSHGRARVDVMLFDGATLVAIEAKMSDWKRAIAQATLNRFFADRSYVAVPSARVAEGVLAEAERHGVGVLGVEADGLIVRAAAANSDPDQVLRNRVLMMFSKAD